MTAPGNNAPTNVARLFPRRKAGEVMRSTDKPIVVTRDVLEPLFDRPLREAAQCLHISATALKSICRKLKISRWPFQQRQWSQTRKAKQSRSATDINSLQLYDELYADSMAEAQQRDAERVAEDIKQQATSNAMDDSVYMKREGNTPPSQGRWQSNVDLEMLRWHVPPCDDDLLLDVDGIFDTQSLLQSCNSLTFCGKQDESQSREQVPSTSDAQRPRSLREGIIWRQGACGADKNVVYGESLNVAEDERTAHQNHQPTFWRKRVQKQGDRAAPVHERDFVATAAAEAAMTKEQLFLCGYTDCDLGYLVFAGGTYV